MREYPGLFVVLEGGEGTGKSTLLRALDEFVCLYGIEPLVTKQPGGTAVGVEIRDILLNPATERPSTLAEVMLFAADRADHVAKMIQPHLDSGGVVLCDRYIDSSVAYQGGGRGVSGTQVEELSHLASGGLYPDLTIILDMDPEVAMKRVSFSEFGEADGMESEKLDFHQRIRQTFLDQALKHPDRYIVIDANESKLAVRDKAEATLGALLLDRGLTNLAWQVARP